MKAFVQAGYLMALKEKKQDFNTKAQEVSPPIFGLLSEKEYQNPLLVFKKAFREYSVQEFNYFCPEWSISQWASMTNYQKGTL